MLCLILNNNIERDFDKAVTKISQQSLKISNDYGSRFCVKIRRSLKQELRGDHIRLWPIIKQLMGKWYNAGNVYLYIRKKHVEVVKPSDTDRQTAHQRVF